MTRAVGQAHRVISNVKKYIHEREKRGLHCLYQTPVEGIPAEKGVLAAGREEGAGGRSRVEHGGLYSTMWGIHAGATHFLQYIRSSVHEYHGIHYCIYIHQFRLY